MIPTKAKGVYLLPVLDGWVSNPFNMPNHAGYDKSKPNHNGIDIGYTHGHPYVNVMACQDGTVMEVFNNNSSVGNGICLQHDYADGTHSWTAYIHLKDKPTHKVGAKVKQGEVIGVRGGSPYINGKAKYGVHLHLYMTKPVTSKYTWNTMKANVIDPFPHLYKSKALTYTLAGVLNDIPFIEDAIPEVVEPVERDEHKNQLTEKASNLRVRMEASLKGTVIGYLKPNVFYNYYDVAEADGYTWYCIAESQWVAKTDTMTVLPAKTEVEMLKESIDALTKENEQLRSQYETERATADKLERKNELLMSRIAQIRNIAITD